MDRFFIITGGPGSGKSTLIEALVARGYRAMPEAGRAIIQDHVAIGGPALPWADRQAFAAQMLGWDMRSWREAAAKEGVTFFDRGIVDVVGYLRLCGLPVPDHLVTAARRLRYNPTVFIAPPWEAIYAPDSERKQTPEDARATFEAMAAVYPAFGYSLIPLPLASVEDRVRFVVGHLSRALPDGF